MLKSRSLLRWVLALAVFGIDVLVWGGDTRAFNGDVLPPALVIGVGVIGYGFLAVPRGPVPGYIAMVVLSLGVLLVPAVESLAGFLLALFLMARHLPRRRARAALAWALVPISANTYTGVSFHEPAEPLFVALNAGLWVVLVLAVWVAGCTLARTGHRLATERKWAAEARAEATAVERLRISRDLHDSVAHSLTAILLQVAGVRAATRAGNREVDVERVLADVQETAEQSMRELHRMLGMLRSTEDEDGTRRPHGLEDIDGLIDSSKASGLEVASTTRGTPRPLDPSIEHTAYRVVQEGLSNAMKHAGQGAKVEVGCHWRTESLVLTLRSVSGVPGRRPISGGYGLEGLRERVGVSGGTLHAGPAPDGFLLQATLPATPRPGTTHTQNPEEE